MPDLSDSPHVAMATQLGAWRQQYGEVYMTEFAGDEGAMFVWRPLNEMEFKEITQAPFADELKEEAICLTCVLYPESFDFSSCPMAGYATILAQHIVKTSYYDSPQRALDLLATYRQEMAADFSSQLDCMVAEAFPQYPVEMLRQMPMKRRLWLLSRAEWTLVNLRGVPLVHNTLGSPAASSPQRQPIDSAYPDSLAPHMAPASHPVMSHIRDAVDDIYRDEHYRGPDPDWIFDAPDDDFLG